jgi:hypothetical protein
MISMVCNTWRCLIRIPIRLFRVVQKGRMEKSPFLQAIDYYYT